ncbi:MAG: MBL fold metallo-hydrolase [Azonexus sp.]|nr:MBL fold metallo-hydrolase [Azonexus sp.]
MKKILLALLGAVLFNIQSVHAEGVLTVDALGDGIFALIGQTAGRTPENHGLNANYGVIDTPEGAILIDAGASTVAARVLDTEVRKLTGKPVKWVINTGAQDHRWLGNGHFAAQGAQIIALARTVATQTRLGKGQIEALQRELKTQMDGTEPHPSRQALADDRQTLTLGGRTLQLQYFADAHFPGDAVVWLPKERILISGDYIYVDRLLGILPESNATTWLDAFNQALALQPARIVPGHGRVCDAAQAQRESGDYLAFVVNGTRKLADDMAGVDVAVQTLNDAPAFSHLKNFSDLHRGNVNRAYLRMEAGN